MPASSPLTELIEPVKSYRTAFPRVFEEPSPTLAAVFKVLGEHALAAEFKAQVGRNNGIDRRGLEY